MVPAFFGSPPLFSVHHPPTRRGGVEKDAVLVCPPIGHEHTRSHRALRVLSQALARAGHHVLRFDYRGLGDSWGQPGDGSVARWCDDVEVALRQTATLAGARRVHVVGLRMGAALASAALARERVSGPRVERLVLWDPVVSGAEFLDTAKALQAAFLNDSGRFVALATRRPSRRRVPGQDLVGYAYPPDLRESLQGLNLQTIAPWPVARTNIVLSRASASFEDLARRLREGGHEVGCSVVEGTDGAWESYEQHEQSLRPGRIVPFIVAALKAEAP